ncbi:MAG: hypothetical protein AAGI45_03555 [Cyanobacteria bacterium P01_H01_bin.26]
MKHLHCSSPNMGTLMFILGLSTWGGLPSGALANTFHNGCYVEDESGQVVDLSLLCKVPGQGTEPVLQTGDVQVTLRWNTDDDLDLIVVDPAGDIVDFGSPTSLSGGQLDVDANGFCQTQNFSPVENIFWPTGGAPDGEYLAYVTLAIPCSLEELASLNGTAANRAYESLEVPYSLTILNRGEVTSYDGISSPEQFGGEYPFQVGLPTEATEETTPAESDGALDLPSFGLPNL